MVPIYKILVLNIGSTTTKVAFFENHHLKVQEIIGYDPQQVGSLMHYMEQFHLRRQGIVKFLEKHRIVLGDLHMIVSRGGLTAPITSGVYLVDERMCDDLRSGKYGQHPTNLGPLIAHDLAKQTGVRAVIVDSPSTDEYQPLARVSGIPEIERKSAFHALNQKAAARRAADEMGISYEACNMIVAHLGGGITIGAHRKGRVIDSTIGLGEGPMTPERAGTLPTVDLLRFLESGQFSLSDLRRRLTSRGGLIAYLGTNDVSRVETKIQEGDEKALLILQAMAYQIAKDIGAMSTVLHGQVDAVVLTGGLANSSRLAAWISKQIGFIAPVKVYPGENEMHALAQGALRVLSGTESVKHYSPLEKV
ncbi:MAG: butyrate kinase [Desulfobacteraceae bacterium]|nr:butyrate kinase [Desulfobacteraceae bacterium]